MGHFGTAHACTATDAGSADASARALAAVCAAIWYATDTTHATDVGSGTFAVHGYVEWTVLRWIQLIRRTFYESARACTFLLSAERVDAQHAWARADVLTLLASNQFRRRASVAGSTTVATQPEYAGTALRAKRDADSTATHGSG